MSRPRSFSLLMGVLLFFTTACGVSQPTSTPNLTTPTAESTVTDSTGILVIPSHTAYPGEFDTYHLVGEILNTSDLNMRFIKVIATLYDETGQITGVGSAYTYADILSPHTKTPFNIELHDQEIPSSYKLQLEGFDTDAKQLKNLEITTQRVRKWNFGGYDFVGEIKNNRSIQAEHVRIIVTLYDADDRVVGAGYTFSELNEIPSGGTSPFTIWIYDDIHFDHYELMISD